jgi:hypothetical protein
VPIPPRDCPFVLKSPPCFSWGISLFPGKKHRNGRSNRLVQPGQRGAHPVRGRHLAEGFRRYALFTLVGIAGEDDLDAPGPPGRPQRRRWALLFADDGQPSVSARRKTLPTRHVKPVLAPDQSASLPPAAMPSATASRPRPSSVRWRTQKITKRSKRPSSPTMMPNPRWSVSWCCG